MRSETVIETDRLILRHWCDDDLDAFARMCMDERVMEFFPSVQDRQTCQDTIQWIAECRAENGFCLWATEVKDGAPFIGFVGLSVPTFKADFSPCVEVGWRLAFEHWGNGYATEGARAALTYGFETAGLNEIVSFTVVGNLRSRAVMERLGMTRDKAGDFNHPSLDPASPLCAHVLYRIDRNSMR